MESTYKLLDEAVESLRQRGFGKPRIALILGSGLGGLAGSFQEAVAVDYRDIPGFPPATIPGHAGRLVWGKLQGVDAVAMQGRFHYYEGHSQRQIAFALWTMRSLGAEILIVTNAAGGINPDFRVGDLMLIADHINMTGDNPLIGPNPDRFGPRFPDMSRAYTPELRELALEAATGLKLNLQQGVYLSVTGPCFETPAEIQSFRRLGADAVGMSTVPEVITAVHAGMKVLGISCITNMAAGLGAEKLDHQEVIDVTKKVQSNFQALVTEIIALIGRRIPQ
ncbi:MAG: purine-nucleoside phosphorylase [Bacillota bacterium]|nr:purine-nucleoside phosphorylase [Bacillota bacterium]HOC06341.1 purine-nucleoside phosphorylase [Bacillota bacterium]HPZ21755.1 purine-nucleoside phosphorylase [Bacillota bacterium]HQD19198.1 purine-nucleoside phosphorylase [Bacillota bacterium]